jgi:hypothetical protein
MLCTQAARQTSHATDTVTRCFYTYLFELAYAFLCLMKRVIHFFDVGNETHFLMTVYMRKESLDKFKAEYFKGRTSSYT